MSRDRRSCAVLVLALVLGCVGSTSLEETHPLLAEEDAADTAKVYFIRPDPGFRGAMDMPATISLEGDELLRLAKGEYTLLVLKAGDLEMVVDSYTVKGSNNTMTPVSSTTPSGAAASSSPRGRTSDRARSRVRWRWKRSAGSPRWVWRSASRSRTRR